MMANRRVSSSSVLLTALLLLLPFFAAASVVSTSDDDECVYTVYIRTGSVIKGGTDSKIGLSLADSTGRGFAVSDLEAWGGLMGPTHDYFERGHLDVFSGRGPCGLSPPLCRLNVTSDGSGPHHGWYCEYVEVTATGPHVDCAQTLFYVRQWLANDAPPYELSAVVDGCDQVPSHRGHGGGSGALVVGKNAHGSTTFATSSSSQ